MARQADAVRYLADTLPPLSALWTTWPGPLVIKATRIRTPLSAKARASQPARTRLLVLSTCAARRGRPGTAWPRFTNVAR